MGDLLADAGNSALLVIATGDRIADHGDIQRLKLAMVPTAAQHQTRQLILVIEPRYPSLEQALFGHWFDKALSQLLGRATKQGCYLLIVACWSRSPRSVR